MPVRPPTIGAQIRAAREAAELTQAQLVEQVSALAPRRLPGREKRPRGHLTQPTLARYEADAREPHIVVLRSIATVLNTTFIVGPL